jgi:ADP-ribose pyrophosphatase
VLGSREIYAAPPFLRLGVEKVRLPDGHVVEDFYKVEMPDYALVVPVLPDGRILLLRQYKHGVGEIGLHPPGGHVAAGEPPLAAVQRELLEETGYEADHWSDLGVYTCNANQGCGRAHFFVAGNARQVADPRSGDLEQMEVVLLSREELFQAMAAGEVNSLGAVAALALALNPEFHKPARLPAS